MFPGHLESLSCKMLKFCVQCLTDFEGGFVLFTFQINFYCEYLLPICGNLLFHSPGVF